MPFEVLSILLEPWLIILKLIYTYSFLYGEKLKGNKLSFFKPKNIISITTYSSQVFEINFYETILYESVNLYCKEWNLSRISKRKKKMITVTNAKDYHRKHFVRIKAYCKNLGSEEIKTKKKKGMRRI